MQVTQGLFAMMKLAGVLLVTFAAAIASAEEESKHWAVLVAGSNGYFNYRHQVRADGQFLLRIISHTRSMNFI